MTLQQAADDVAAFHRATDTPILTSPKFPDAERVLLRAELVSEEVQRELLPAMITRNMVETADAIVDSIYVLVGTALELGLPLQELWDEVQRANMTKAVQQPDGTLKVLKREDGKVLKPEGWKPPDIEGVLIRHGWHLPASV